MASTTKAQSEMSWRDPQTFCLREVAGSPPICRARPMCLAVGDIMSVGSAPNYDVGGPDGWPDVVVINANPGGDAAAEEIVIFANTKAWNTSDPPPPGLVKKLSISVCPGGEWPCVPCFECLAHGAEPWEVDLSDWDGDGDLDIVFSVGRDPTLEETICGTGSKGPPPAVGVIINRTDESSHDFDNPIYPSWARPTVVQRPTSLMDTEIGGIGGWTAVGLQAGDFDGPPALESPTSDAVIAGIQLDTPSNECSDPDPNEPRIELMTRNESYELDHQGRDPNNDELFQQPTGVLASILQNPAPANKRDFAIGSFDQAGRYVILWDINYDPDPNWTGAINPELMAPNFWIAAGFFDNSSGRDLVLTGPGADQILVTSNDDGIGEFEVPEDWPTSPLTDPYGVATGRLDDDQTVDIAVACQGGSQSPWTDRGGVKIFLGNGSGQFGTDAELDADPNDDPGPAFIKIRDMNLDCRDDLIISCSLSGKISVIISDLSPCDD